MHKYGESKTARIVMATVSHVTSSSGLRKFQGAWFLLNRLYQCKSKQQGLQAEGAASKRHTILTSYKQPTEITVLIKHCLLFHTIYITPVQSTFWFHNRRYGGSTQVYLHSHIALS